MKSGTVTATTVSIPNYQRDRIDLEVVISAKDGSQQYQMRTFVDGPREDAIENIDSPEWMIVSPPTRFFQTGGSLVTECKVFVPHDQRDEGDCDLRANHAVMGTGSKPPKMEIDKLMNIPKSLDHDFAEEHGSDKTILTGQRTKLARRGHTVYELKVQVSNANITHQGVYQCVVVRAFDKAYIASTITISGQPPIFPSYPKAELISCDKADKGSLITIKTGEETCIRCRGYGTPRPEVSIYKGTVEFATMAWNHSV